MISRLAPRIGLAAALFCMPSALCAQNAGAGNAIDMTRVIRQSDAVLARYPDLPIAMMSPALADGRTTFTTQEEMEGFLADLRRRNPRIVGGELGRSQQGRALPYLVFTPDGNADPAHIRASGRPVIWLIGQQHGNEPAGGEAMLALSSALASGELKAFAEKLTIVIVPRANPDGAAAFRRATANGADPNRDHILLTLPETRALHAKMAELPPDIVIDAHEFSVANRWIEKFGGLQKSDAMILYATHPLVPRAVTNLAADWVMPAIQQSFDRFGLTSFWYHTTSANSADKVVSMGGNAPGIARNAFGLANAVSFLVETRGVGVGMDAWQRRVGTHYVIIKTVLETIAGDPQRLLAALAEGRRMARAGSEDLVLAHKLPVNPIDLPLIDPVNGATRIVSAPFRDSRVITPTKVRPRPLGYVIDAAIPDASETLRLNGVAHCLVAGTGAVEGEIYVLSGRPAAAGRENINPDETVKAELRRSTIALAPGAIFVPFDQPAAGLAAAALEPDSPGSLVGTGIFPTRAGSDEAPVARIEPGATLPPMRAANAESAAACGR